MTIDELQQALSQALETGKIGTPVSLRLHCWLAHPQADLTAAFAALLPLAERCFSSPGGTLIATQDAQQRQLNVLLQQPSGTMVFVTLGRGAAAHDGLHLLLVGNHGVVHLEDGGRLDDVPPAPPAAADRWRAAIAQSLESRAAVPTDRE